MFELFLVRHGQTDWNASPRVMGRKPVPLNMKGVAQAGEAAVVLSEIKLSAIITSPVLRALQTADLIASRQDALTPIEDEALSEIDYGDWQDLTFDELEKNYPELWNGYFKNPEGVVFPNGEAMTAVKGRVHDAIGRAKKLCPLGRVAIVTHADIVKIAMIDLLGLDWKWLHRFKIENCSVTKFCDDDKVGPRLVAYNTTGGILKTDDSRS